MKRKLLLAMIGASILGIILCQVWFASANSGAKLDADKIASASGAKATTSPDGVVRISWVRTDVPVKVDGMPLKPFAGLGSWAAFTPTEHGAMVMGDTVVFEDEVTHGRCHCRGTGSDGSAQSFLPR